MRNTLLLAAVAVTAISAPAGAQEMSWIDYTPRSSLVVPEHSGGKYLKALARISRFFRDPAFRQRLTDAETLDDVLSAIEEEDAKL